MPTSLLQKTLDTLGCDIVSGRLPEGHVVAAEALAERFDVSRSVVREAIRVLQTIGLVSSVKRVGVRVLSPESWNYFDPLVIRWRLESERQRAQLRSLNELRSAIEPAAAELAARFAPDELCSRLLSLAGQIRAAVRAEDSDRFIDVDVEFHNVVLVGSGNEMFAQLQRPIGNTMSGRSALGLLPELPGEGSQQLHVDLADAIQGRRPDDARQVANELVSAVIDETAPSWRDEPRHFFTVLQPRED